MRSCRCNRPTIRRTAEARHAPAQRSELSPRSGFTLLEVVVGLALMASVLVAALLSFAAHRKQLRAAEDQLTAVGLADELLTRLKGSRDGIPHSGQGPIGGTPGWFWQTRVVGVARPLQEPLTVVQLQVLRLDHDQSLRLVTTVDLVDPLP